MAISRIELDLAAVGELMQRYDFFYIKLGCVYFKEIFKEISNRELVLCTYLGDGHKAIHIFDYSHKFLMIIPKDKGQEINVYFDDELQGSSDEIQLIMIGKSYSPELYFNLFEHNIIVSNENMDVSSLKRKWTVNKIIA